MGSLPFSQGVRVLLVFLTFLFSLEAQIALEPVATYSTGIFNKVATEITAYDPNTRRLFVSNRAGKSITVLDIADPRAPVVLPSIDVSGFGEVPLCVDVGAGLVAVAILANPSTDPGTVAFFTTDGVFVRTVQVGPFPDDVRFTPDGKRVLTANEGVPSGDYLSDPEGSISIIDLTRGVESATVSTAGFKRFNSQVASLRRRGVRIYGPNATVAQDLEPENIAITRDSRLAWVTLQENNAMAVVDIEHARVERILPLGYKPHILGRNRLDASDRDGGILLQTLPVLGIYNPDGIAILERHGVVTVFTANEGDPRDYPPAFSEEARGIDLTLSPLLLSAFPDLQANNKVGRLRVSKSPPYGKTTDSAGDIYHLLFSFGGRSFSAWNEECQQIFDSGDDFEVITAEQYPTAFNSTESANNTFDTRSDDKGPEPEELVIGRVDGRDYLFVGLERMGGVIVYDVTRPRASHFVTYVNTRDFTATNPSLAGGLSPEGMTFIGQAESPTGEAFLAVAFTVSGTVTIFKISSSAVPVLPGPHERSSDICPGF